MNRHILPATSRALQHRTGTSALEFSLVAPVLFMLVFGIINVALLFNNYLELTYSVRAASRVLATSRGSATPYTGATTAFYAAAPNLTKASITLAMTVAGGACSADSGCSATLTGASGGTTNVTASYPCSLTIMGVNFAPGCTLNAQMTERVE